MCARSMPRRRLARVLTLVVACVVALGVVAHQRAIYLDWQELDRAVQLHRQELRTREALTILERVESRRSGTLLGGKALLARIDLHDYLGEYDVARALTQRAIVQYAGTSTGDYAKLRLDVMQRVQDKQRLRRQGGMEPRAGSATPDRLR